MKLDTTKNNGADSDSDLCMQMVSGFILHQLDKINNIMLVLSRCLSSEVILRSHHRLGSFVLE